MLDEAGNCDAVILLRDGRILAAETPEALRRDAGTDDLDEAFLRLIERRTRRDEPPGDVATARRISRSSAGTRGRSRSSWSCRSSCSAS